MILNKCNKTEKHKFWSFFFYKRNNFFVCLFFKNVTNFKQQNTLNKLKQRVQFCREWHEKTSVPATSTEADTVFKTGYI